MEEKLRRFWIINPAGAIHEVSREHARDLLKQPGFRQASAEEVRMAMDESGNLRNQRFDQPLFTPWSPEPVEVDLEE